MFISFIRRSSYIESPFFKTLVSWRVGVVLLCLILLFVACIYCIRRLFVEKKSKRKLAIHHQPPLQTRKRFISQSEKTTKRKSATQMSRRSTKSHQRMKSNKSIAPSPTIKISLILPKDINDRNDASHIDQTLSNISSLTIHGIADPISKRVSI